MDITPLFAVFFLLHPLMQAVSAAPPAANRPPTLAEVRSEMGIPSEGTDLRGQKDTVGYASRADQMAKVWDLAATPPPPDRLGDPPPPGVAAVIAPHDDFAYAGRVYRQVLPLVTARTVIVIGVFHRYRAFGMRDRLVFDPYKAWRAPDGTVPVSSLREDLIARLQPGDFVQDAASHDSEHSVEAQVFWLRRARPDVEIVPIIVPAARFDRLEELAGRLATALAAVCRDRGWVLGRDVAIVISADGVHYGPDFKYVPYGEGGIEPYRQAVEHDVGILRGPLAGPLDRAKLRDLFATFVNPDQPDEYRMTWCGRFSIPLGLLLLERTAAALDGGRPIGHPVAYATSVGWPALPLEEVGLDATAPASLYHFVGLPGAAFTLEKR